MQKKLLHIAVFLKIILGVETFYAMEQLVDFKECKVDLAARQAQRELQGDAKRSVAATVSSEAKAHVATQVSKVLQFPVVIENLINQYAIDSFDYAEAMIKPRTIRDGAMIHSLIQLSDNRIASASRMVIKVWSIETGECLNVLEGHTDDITSLIQLTGNRIASGSDDATIKIWDLDSAACIMTLEGHTDGVKSLVQLSGNRIASGSEDETIKIWDLAAGTCKVTLEGHAKDASVTSLIQLSDNRIVSGSCDDTIKIWDAETGVCITTLMGHVSNTDYLLIQLLNGRPDGVKSLIQLSGNRIAVGLFVSGAIKILNLDTGKCIGTLEGHTDGIYSLIQLPKNRIASGSSDNTIKIWDLATCLCISTLEGHTGYVSSLVQLPDNTFHVAKDLRSFPRIASGSWDGTIRIWEISDDSQLKILYGLDVVWQPKQDKLNDSSCLVS